MTDINSCPACGSDVLEIFHKLESEVGILREAREI